MRVIIDVKISVERESTINEATLRKVAAARPEIEVSRTKRLTLSRKGNCGNELYQVYTYDFNLRKKRAGSKLFFGVEFSSSHLPTRMLNQNILPP